MACENCDIYVARFWRFLWNFWTVMLILVLLLIAAYVISAIWF